MLFFLGSASERAKGWGGQSGNIPVMQPSTITTCYWPAFVTTADLCTKILDFGGFDSIIILSLRGVILRSIGNSPENLSQQILVGITLVGRLGALVTHRKRYEM